MMREPEANKIHAVVREFVEVGIDPLPFIDLDKVIEAYGGDLMAQAQAWRDFLDPKPCPCWRCRLKRWRGK